MTLETKLEKPLTSGVNAFSANLGSSALKMDCDIMSFEWKFRLQLWFIQSRLLTPLTWLLSKRVPVAKDFGRFDKDKSTLDLGDMLKPLDGRLVSIEEMNVCRTSVDTVLLDEVDGNEIEPLTPEQYTVIANAEPKKRGNVVESLLPAEAAEILKAREAQRIERWKTLLAVSAGAAGLVGLLFAMVSLFLAR